MSKRALLVLSAAVAVVAALALLVPGNPFSRTGVPPGSASSTSAPSGASKGREDHDRAITLPDPTELTGAAADPAEPDAPGTADEVWKERLQGLLGSVTLGDRELGKALLTIVADPEAPEWARVNAMANSLNFVDDGNYAEDIKPLAIRRDLPEAVNDVILEDLIPRDPATILPVAREFVAVGDHPLSAAIEGFVKSLEEPEVE